MLIYFSRGPQRRKGNAYLSEPPAHVVPANTNNVSSFETASAWVVNSITLTLLQKMSITEAQVVDEQAFINPFAKCFTSLGASVRVEVDFASRRLGVAAHKSLVAFAHDVRLAAPKKNTMYALSMS